MNKPLLYLGAIGFASLIIVLLMLACASDHISNTGRVPATPTELSGGAISSSVIMLTWQDNSDNEDGFYLYRRLAGLPVWTKIATLAENTTAFTNQDLIDSTAYTYYVSAYNISGSSPASATLTLTTRAIGLPPEAPFDQVPWNGADSVARNSDLIWRCSDPDGDSLKYDIYLGTRNPPGVLDTSLVDTSYAVNGLLADTVYYWQVTARDPHKHRVPSQIWWFRTATQKFGIVYNDSIFTARYTH